VVGETYCGRKGNLCKIRRRCSAKPYRGGFAGCCRGPRSWGGLIYLKQRDVFIEDLMQQNHEALLSIYDFESRSLECSRANSQVQHYRRVCLEHRWQTL
jgi:hypothetical protein